MENFEDYNNPENKDENATVSTATDEFTQEGGNEHTVQSQMQEERTQQTFAQEEPKGEQMETKEEPKSEDPKSTQPKSEGPRKSNKIKNPKGNFIKRHRTASVIAACIILSAAAGFGGSVVALNFTNSNRAVLYQSVSNNNKGKTSNTSNGQAMSVKDVANKTMDSVVQIYTESVSTNSFFPQAIQSGAGSGVILSKDGYIVTNNHVIDGANSIKVTTKDGKNYTAKLIGADPTSDLAVVKIDANNLVPAVLGESSKLQVGDPAIAIGNPLGELGGTVTTGIISALDREVTIDNQTQHLLQTNAAINPGNSGGGLFNDQGQLIGIVNAKSAGSNIEGLGFAIPIDRAKDVISSLIKHGQVVGRASLGVTLQEGTSNNPFDQQKKNQVYIVQVVKGKAADKAGIKAGDQILKVDGKDIASISDVKSAVNAHKSGEKMKITVLRNNETKTFTATLDEATKAQTNIQKNQPEDKQNNDDNNKDKGSLIPFLN